jgi:hypothetical protein
MDSLGIELTTKQGQNMLIIVVYKSPCIYNRQFINKFDKLLDNINNKSCYIYGDLNIDILKNDINVDSQSFVNIMFSHGFQPCIDSASRISKNSATLIDNIWNNKHTDLTNCITGLIIDDISDHLPTFMIENSTLKNTSDPTHLMNKRQMTPQNLNRLSNGLRNHSWNDVTSLHDACNAYNTFEEVLNKYINKYSPILRHKHDKRDASKPWLTEGLINASRKQNYLYKIFINIYSKEG